MEGVVTYFNLFLLVVALCSAGKIPDYVQKCVRGDPKFGDCIIAAAGLMIPNIINGDDGLHLLNLNPLKVKEIEIAATDTLTVKLLDIEVIGLGNAVFQKVEADFDKNTAFADVYLEEVFVEGTYDVEGRILVLPIVGHGPAHIKFDKAVFTFSFGWDLVERDGNQYASLKDNKLTYKTGREHYHLDNLFNGDKALGDQMNLFLDENWQEFGKDISPAVSKTISDEIMNIFSTVANNVPWKDLFLE